MSGLCPVVMILMLMVKVMAVRAVTMGGSVEHYLDRNKDSGALKTNLTKPTLCLTQGTHN